DRWNRPRSERAILPEADWGACTGWPISRSGVAVNRDRAPAGAEAEAEATTPTSRATTSSRGSTRGRTRILSWKGRTAMCTKAASERQWTGWLRAGRRVDRGCGRCSVLGRAEQVVDSPAQPENPPPPGGDPPAPPASGGAGGVG